MEEQEEATEQNKAKKAGDVMVRGVLKRYGVGE